MRSTMLCNNIMPIQRREASVIMEQRVVTREENSPHVCATPSSGKVMVTPCSCSSPMNVRNCRNVLVCHLLLRNDFSDFYDKIK